MPIIRYSQIFGAVEVLLTNINLWLKSCTNTFATKYLCKTGFSSYTSTKTKYYNELDAETGKRQLSSLKPNIKVLVHDKSQHY